MSHLACSLFLRKVGRRSCKAKIFPHSSSPWLRQDAYRILKKCFKMQQQPIWSWSGRTHHFILVSTATALAFSKYEKKQIRGKKKELLCFLTAMVIKWALGFLVLFLPFTISFKSCLFIWKAESNKVEGNRTKERGSEQNKKLVLESTGFTLSHSCKSKSWIRLKSEARNSNQVFHMWGRNTSIWATMCCLQVH